MEGELFVREESGGEGANITMCVAYTFSAHTNLIGTNFPGPVPGEAQTRNNGDTLNRSHNIDPTYEQGGTNGT